MNLARLARVLRGRRLPWLVFGFVVSAVAVYMVAQPRRAYALTRETTLTVLGGSVEIWTTDHAGYAAVPVGTWSAPLHVGDRLRTGPDGHAVLTYFEGSTTELEPNTELTITQLQDPASGSRSSLRLALYEWRGATWNKVVKMVDPNAQFTVGTSNAVIAVRGTAFEVGVGADAGGQLATSVITEEGVVTLSSQGQSVDVATGQQSSAVLGQPPAAPAPVPRPTNAIRVGVGSPANLLICDALNRCVGFYAPAGVTVDTLPDVWYSGPGSEPEVIAIPFPKGQYRLSLQATGNGGQIHFTIVGLHGDVAGPEDKRLLTLTRGQTLTATFRVAAGPNGQIIVTPVSDFTSSNGPVRPPEPFAQRLVAALQRTPPPNVAPAGPAPQWFPVLGFFDTQAGSNISVQTTSAAIGSATASATTSSVVSAMAQTTRATVSTSSAATSAFANTAPSTPIVATTTAASPTLSQTTTSGVSTTTATSATSAATTTVLSFATTTVVTPPFLPALAPTTSSLATVNSPGPTRVAPSSTTPSLTTSLATPTSSPTAVSSATTVSSARSSLATNGAATTSPSTSSSATTASRATTIGTSTSSTDVTMASTTAITSATSATIVTSSATTVSSSVSTSATSATTTSTKSVTMSSTSSLTCILSSCTTCNTTPCSTTSSTSSGKSESKDAIDASRVSRSNRRALSLGKGDVPPGRGSQPPTDGRS